MTHSFKIRHQRHLRRLQHIHEPLKLAPSPWAWTPSIQIAVATAIPLALGILQGQPQLALIGSIAGFLIVLNDPGGRLAYRLIVYFFTAILLAAGYLLGQATHIHPAAFYIGAAGLSYWIGLMGTRGAELERAVLFALFHYFAGHYLNIPKEALPLLALYGAYALTISCALACLLRRTPLTANAPTLPTLFRQSVSRDRASHRYAQGFTLTLLFCLAFIDLTRFERGYWIAGTVLLLIRPDSTQSLHRIYQRFFGTFIGLVAAIALISVLHHPWELFAVITLCSFLTPWALARNHWLGTLFVTVMISLMFDLLTPVARDYHTPWLRFVATCIACGFAILPLTLDQLTKISR